MRGFVRAVSGAYPDGTYERVDGPRGPWALVVCPQCENNIGVGTASPAASLHTIDHLGIVRPEVGCGHRGCDFAEAIRLLDWTP